MSHKKSNKIKRIATELSDQGYSESAKKAIKQWYQPPKNETNKLASL